MIEQNICIYFVGRTGFIRLFIGALNCADADSEFVDNDAPPIEYYLVDIHR
jgi:hypothetical protein